MKSICYHCGGTGDENASGPRIGACRVCAGSGFTARVQSARPAPYAVTLRPEELAAQDRLAAYIDAHEHHAN